VIDGYARVSTDGQSVEAQVAALTAAGAVTVYRTMTSGATTRPRVIQFSAGWLTRSFSSAIKRF